MDNPLFDCATSLAFDRIDAAQVEPGVRELVKRQDAALTRLEQELDTTSASAWSTVVEPLSNLAEPLSYAWSVVQHLMGVRNAPDLRAAHDAVQGEVVASSMRIGQSEPVYRALKRLRAAAGWTALDEAQRRIVEAGIVRAEHAGIGLQGKARQRFNAIEIELADLSTRFANHVLDSSKAFALVLRDGAEADGLPPSLRAAAAQAARAAKDDAAATPDQGPWRITLEAAMYGPFMEHSRRRDLRERLYRANISRASMGEHDNQPLIERILALRCESAALLGQESYAYLKLPRKMAGTVEAVERLLGELRAAAKPRATSEFAELTDFARGEAKDATQSLAHWDVPFWAERLRERRYAFSDEELRPYFSLPRVLDGLFALAHRLFAVTVTPADGAVPVWHADVRYFRIADQAGTPLAAFYLDPYSRPADKRGGAWMNNAIDRKRRDGAAVRLPIAYLVCNFPQPVGEAPSLLTFRDVETLFHEFGHGLQHMLTTVDYPDAAGINNIEWDAVELASQFMENWCYHRQTLLDLARHWQSGAALPEDLYRKIVAARTYRSASATLRQVYASTLDLELHHRYVPGSLGGIDAVMRRIARDNTILPPLAEDRFLCAFSHIFAGGYEAGYYSYKWAEVLSADAFAAFEEAGLDDPRCVATTGKRFRDTVLALGGGRHPLAVFTAFRGRAPTTVALLKQLGLAS